MYYVNTEEVKNQKTNLDPLNILLHLSHELSGEYLVQE
jgi:hypothetical protein